ncbi:MAG: VanZ family protein [Propionibacteriaceae bacterium]|nr:VanZ family protein [Propionibacteriaceae bacterium]
MRWRWLVALLALAVQMWALYHPDPVDAPALFDVPHLDKVVHVGLFWVTTWALLRVLPAWAAIGAMVLQVAASELIQGFLPTRSADVWDAVADLGGIALGWATWWWREQRRAA